MTFQNHIGEEMHISSLDMAHRQFSIAPKEKFQDQLILIQLTQINKSKINNANIKTKHIKDDNFKFNVWRKLTKVSNL